MSEKQEKKDENLNILKSRDDQYPIKFIPVGMDDFRIKEGIQCPWQKTDKDFKYDILRQRIEPWLTALFQSEHLSLLVGSGLTHAVHVLSTKKFLQGMNKIPFSTFQSRIDDAAKETAKRAGREDSNIEDQIRVSNELLIGLNHFCPPSIQFEGHERLIAAIIKLKEEIQSGLYSFAKSILEGEKGIALGDYRIEGFGYLVNFLMSPASRSGTRDRLHIFTTNYDRVIEAGAEVAGLHLIDRFVGNIAPIFRSSRLSIDMHYNPPGIRGEPRYLEGVVRFTKLHGSVDWINSGRDIRRIGLPFGVTSVDPFLDSPEFENVDAMNLMIYPNAAKDRETAAYPYVDLFRDFAAAICRPNHTLVTYGYGFGDEHINRVIEDMLTIPSTHLVIISFNDPLGRIMGTYEKVARPAQTTLLIGNRLGDLKTLVDQFMPKPAIDRTTFRMAELLKTRFGLQQDKKKTDEESEGE